MAAPQPWIRLLRLSRHHFLGLLMNGHPERRPMLFSGFPWGPQTRGGVLTVGAQNAKDTIPMRVGECLFNKFSD